MSEHGHEHHQHQHHDHSCCANLFGCGDEKGTGIIREDIKDAAFDKRASDRLLHMDEVDQETLDGYLSARGRWRRKFLQASSFMGALAAVEPWFGRLARAQERRRGADARVRSRGRPRARGPLDQGDGAARRVRRQLAADSHDRLRATSSAFPIPGRTSSTRCSRACRSTRWRSCG